MVPFLLPDIGDTDTQHGEIWQFPNHTETLVTLQPNSLPPTTGMSLSADCWFSSKNYQILDVFILRECLLKRHTKILPTATHWGQEKLCKEVDYMEIIVH